jgi:hypothetical protein
MSDVRTALKLLPAIVTILSCLCSIMFIFAVVSAGYQQVGDCLEINLPLGLGTVPLCRQTPVASQPTQVTFTESPAIVPTLAQPVIIFTETTSPIQENIYDLVSLESIGGTQASKRSYLNVDFLVGNIVTTQSEVLQNNPNTLVIDVHQTKATISKVHLLWQAGWGTVIPNTEFGHVDIIFSDGRKLQEILKIGYNIRDWSVVNSPLTAPYAQEAWKGSGNSEVNGQQAIVDMVTIEIPSEFRQLPIIRIEIYDESSTKLNSLNPAIHLWAITIE